MLINTTEALNKVKHADSNILSQIANASNDTIVEYTSGNVLVVTMKRPVSHSLSYGREQQKAMTVVQHSQQGSSSYPFQGGLPSSQAIMPSASSSAGSRIE